MLLPNIDESQLLIVPSNAYSKLIMTHLRDHKVMSDAFKRGKQSRAIPNYDEHIDSFTNAVEILEMNLSVALIHRTALSGRPNRSKINLVQGLQNVLGSLSIHNT